MPDLISAIETATTAMTDQIAATGPDQLSSRTPCDQWDAKDLIEHTKGTCDFLAGVAGGTPGNADLWAGDTAAAFAASGDAALDAWRARGLDGTVDLGGNEMPAPIAAGILALDVYVHAWDLARATGGSLTLDDDVCELLLETTAPALEGGRGSSFGPAVDVGASAPASDRLVAFSGRKP